MATRTQKATAFAGAALGAAATGAALLARGRSNRRRILADPIRGALDAPLAGEPSEVVAADGTRIHVEAFGPPDGPPIVLVHGWVCALRLWILQIQDLARDHRLIAWDLRGHGRSERPRNRDYSIEALAGDLDAVLEATLPRRRPAVVAGHSLGGMTLLAWAGLHPERVHERVAAAALISTGAGGLIAESLVVRSPAAIEWTRDLLGRAILTAPGKLPPRPNPISHELLRQIALSPKASPATVEFCERLVLSCNPAVRAGCGATLSRLDLRESVASLDVPSVVVAGELDRLTPPAHSRRLVDALPSGSYRELRGIGHMAPLESPAEVSGAIRDLAREHIDRPAGSGSKPAPAASNPSGGPSRPATGAPR